LTTGDNLGTPWQGLAYADSNWPNRDGVLGYGQAFVNSTLDFAPAAYPPITTYFRKEFVINDDPGQVTGFELQANYDDGFVAYINGHEVVRRSMPPGLVAFDTLASEHAGGSYETIDLVMHTNKLIQGGNVIAVEVHQASFNDPDLVWDAELTYSALSPPEPIHITFISLGPGASLTLEWNSVPGLTYHVEGSNDLNSWSDLSGPFQANSTTSQYVHAFSPGAARQFYRVRNSQ
jgi:hypothetical protein